MKPAATTTTTTSSSSVLPPRPSMIHTRIGGGTYHRVFGILVVLTPCLVSLQTVFLLLVVGVTPCSYSFRFRSASSFSFRLVVVVFVVVVVVVFLSSYQ